MTRRDMIRVMALTVVPLGAIVAPPSARAQTATAGTIRWQRSLADALQEARRTGQRVMVAFDADWCPYSRRMERETFTDAGVVALSRRFICVQARNGTASGQTMEQEYGIDTWPTLLFLDSDGDVVRQAEGFQSASAFAALLREMAPAGTSERRSFWFYYSFEPKGDRYWRQINADTWSETYPDGQSTLFRLRGAATVDGVHGTVVRRISDNGLDVFIPDDLSTGMWIRFRTPGAAAWSYLAQVRGR